MTAAHLWTSTGKTVILVDDGLATGASMLAAVQALREAEPARDRDRGARGPESASREAWCIGTNLTGSGLTNLRQRADEVGGLFTVESVPTGGTELRRCAPLP